MRLLLVEDDPMLGETLRDALKDQGYVVDWLTNGKTALAALEDNVTDLMILDLGLPGLDGLTVLESIRKQGSALPVLILTARDSIDDRVAGLDAGADDYLLKPFDLNELFARIRALARRPRAIQTSERLKHGALEVDTDQMLVWRDGKPVTLTRREFALLSLFISRPGQVFTRQQLEQALYSWDDDVGSNVLEVHIHHLRKKLGNKTIRTIRGIGYTLSGANE
jgi:DNA-binding response OmpR family regulator